jgi:cysteine sulfinate desulfinase/cysteine desulfurase-like protein
MGIPQRIGAGSIRVSLGVGSDQSEIEALLAVLPDTVARVREALASSEARA